MTDRIYPDQYPDQLRSCTIRAEHWNKAFLDFPTRWPSSGSSMKDLNTPSGIYLSPLPRNLSSTSQDIPHHIISSLFPSYASYSLLLFSTPHFASLRSICSPCLSPNDSKQTTSPNDNSQLAGTDYRIKLQFPNLPSGNHYDYA
jgi:hypothetical protein